MFSKITLAVAMTATAEAGESFYPTRPFVDTLANWKAVVKKANGGYDLRNNSNCNECIMYGGEYVMTKKEEFIPSTI